jgi:hypothetical protein
MYPVIYQVYADSMLQQNSKLIICFQGKRQINVAPDQPNMYQMEVFFPKNREEQGNKGKNRDG